MVAVDTNILIRLLTADDENQFRQSKAIFNSESVFISETVIQESEWVLRHAYNFSAEQIAHSFKALFGLSNVFLKDPTQTAMALDWFEKGLDFSDSLHLARTQMCERFFTFDKKFVKIAAGLQSIPVLIPGKANAEVALSNG